MIREFGESVTDAFFGTVGRAMGRAQEVSPLPADLLESEDAYLVVFDAPGVEPGDAQVRFEDGTVYVRLDRFREYVEGFDMRYPGRGLTLEGRTRLPPDAAVDPAAATATLRTNGSLEVRLPKAEEGEAEETVDVADTVETADGNDTGETADGNDTGEATDEGPTPEA